MPKKPVAVSLRKPQAPADVDSFVGGANAPTPAISAAPRGPLESAADVRHGARDYREMTFYVPTEVARELSFYCIDRNCDANHVVAEAVTRHVSGAPPATAVTASALINDWGAKLGVLAGQAREKLTALWALRQAKS